MHITIARYNFSPARSPQDYFAPSHGQKSVMIELEHTALQQIEELGGNPMLVSQCTWELTHR